MKHKFNYYRKRKVKRRMVIASWGRKAHKQNKIIELLKKDGRLEK